MGLFTALLRDRAGDVRAIRIHIDRARLGRDNEVHVFHRDRAQQNFVPHDDSAAEADTILEMDFQRPDVRNQARATICDG